VIDARKAGDGRAGLSSVVRVGKEFGPAGGGERRMELLDAGWCTVFAVPWPRGPAMHLWVRERCRTIDPEGATGPFEPFQPGGSSSW